MNAATAGVMKHGTRTWKAVPVLAAAVLAVAAFVSGCEVDPGRPHANQPPKTFLSVQADTAGTDTTNYRQTIYWWGSDPDGEVVAYAYHWSGLWRAPADSARWSADTTWVLTKATSARFAVPLGGLFGEVTFEVTAIDDDGASDPSPQFQKFKFSNSAPSAYWKTSPAPPAVSLPAVTFSWGGSDPDGYETIAYYRVWLQGEEPSQKRVVRGDSTLTLVPSDFTHYGENTVYVEPVDEAQAVGDSISYTWAVEAPTGEALLIDAVRSTEGGDDQFHDFYDAQFDSVFGAGNYYELDLEHRDFRTAAEVGPTLSLFPVVMWYTGLSNSDPTREASQFAKAAGGIRDYVRDYGGAILITSMAAVGEAGGISDDIANEVFGIQQIYADSLGSTNLIVRNGTYLFAPPVSDPPDTLGSLKVQTPLGATIAGTQIRYGVDFFEPAAAATPLYFVPPHTLDSRNRIFQETAYYAGVSYSPPGGGRAVLLTFPVARCNSRGNAGAQLQALLTSLASGTGRAQARNRLSR